MLCAGNTTARHRDNSVVPRQPEPRNVPAVERGERRTAFLLELDLLRSKTRTAPLTTDKQPAKRENPGTGCSCRLILRSTSATDFGKHGARAYTD
jgi:hypothetical protein